MLKETSQADPVVGVAVGDADADHVDPEGFDPDRQCVHLVEGHERVDEIASCSPWTRVLLIGDHIGSSTGPWAGAPRMGRIGVT